MSESGELSQTMSDKDVWLIRSVSVNGIIYIVDAAPNVELFVALTTYPSLNISDWYLGYFTHASHIVSNLFQATVCSVNIFVYFRMGSKFKQTFKETFLCQKKLEITTEFLKIFCR